MRIDAHQHFWALGRGDYGWLTQDVGPIFRDFQPDDLRPLLERHNIDGTILVQAAPTVAESEYLLQIAAKTPFVKGVVGWVDFAHKDAQQHIARLAKNAKLVGLRPMIQDINDVDWMLREDLRPSFEELIRQDLTFDALTLPKHLSNLSTLLTRYPEMRVVIDHGSKPEIRNDAFSGWAEDIARLAKETTCFCKLSGLVTEASPDWSAKDLRPFVEHLIACFGADRLIWGSDWPVCTLAASYEQWINTTEVLLEGLTPSDQAAIWGGNALKAYPNVSV